MVTDQAFKRLENKVDAIGHTVASTQAAATAAANRLRPELPFYFALPIAAIAYLFIVYPLRTAGNEVSPYIATAYNKLQYAGETVGVWLARWKVVMPAMSSGQAIRGLSNRQTAELMAVMRQRENSGRYDGWNRYGYVGAYQAGAAALTQTGYLKREAFDQAKPCIQQGTCGKWHLAFIQSAEHWTAGHSYADFMSNRLTQDAFFIALANSNVEVGFKRSVLHADHPKRTAGFIAASHLKGADAAGDWYLHQEDHNDANGSTVSEYAALGESAITVDSGVIQTATRFIGMTEEDHQRELMAFIATAGISLNPAEESWCAAFVNAVLQANSIPGNGKVNARAFLDWGVATTRPQPGDIVVLYRGDRNGWKGHVGFFMGFDPTGAVRILGGNQADKVSIEAFPVTRVLGYRQAPARKIFS